MQENVIIENAPDQAAAHSVLRVEDIACIRGGRPVLRHVSLILGPGELLVISGPNGSGKSSLLRCMAGLLPLAAGTISGTALAPGETIHIGHADPVKSHLTALENLKFWAALGGGAGQHPADAAAAFGLSTLTDLPTHIFSAGQRRRLSLARLVLSQTKLWLLDEPANALDSNGIAQLAAAVADHRSAGGGVVVATHDDLPFAAPRRITLSAGTIAC